MNLTLKDRAESFANASFAFLQRFFPLGSEVQRYRIRWLARQPRHDWESLARKAYIGPNGIASVQDYWRRPPRGGVPRTDPELERAGLLVKDARGVVWHVAHIPFDRKPETGPPKSAWVEADWRGLEAEIADRLEAANATPIGLNFAPLKEDLRARLDGCVLRFCPSPPTSGTVHAVFRSAHFVQCAQLEGATFGACPSFTGALFEGGARFCRAVFNSGADFRRAVFLRDCEFSLADFKERVDFGKAYFLGTASFGGTQPAQSDQVTQFRGDALFKRCRFPYSVDFWRANFGRKAIFENAKFGKLGNLAKRGPATSFREAKFLGEASFGGARFRYRARFLRAEFQSSLNCARVRFYGALEFEDAKIPADTTFDGAQFRMIHGLSLGARLLFWASVGVSMWAVSGTTGSLLPLSPWLLLYALPVAAWISGSRVFYKDERLERVARGFRYMATESKRLGNMKDAAVFLRQEHRALRLRIRRNPITAILSMLYDAIASYGDSIVRPLLLLPVTMGLFAIIYWNWEQNADLTRAPVIGQWEAELDKNFVEAAEFSAHNVVKPLALWSEPPSTEYHECWFVDRIMSYNRRPAAGEDPVACGAEHLRPLGKTDLRLHRSAVRLTATAQSIVSALLLFLFALALRRRFAIG